MACSNSPGGRGRSTTTGSLWDGSPRRRRPLRSPSPERPPSDPIPIPAAPDELLRHPLEILDVVAIPGPGPDPLPKTALNVLEERHEVLPRPRRGDPIEDRGDVAVSPALDEDPPVPELELLQVV